MPDPSPSLLSGWRLAAQVYADRRLLAVLGLGFSSGLPLALTGQTLLARLTDARVDLAALGLFALVGLPYSFKFLWAPLIDRLALPWLTARLGRRRSWALATQAALALALLALGLADPQAGLPAVAGFALAVAVASASQDIVLDALRVEMLERRQYGAGAAVVVLGYRLGMIASGFGALTLADLVSWPVVYAVMAGLTAIGMATVLALPEPPAPAHGPPPAGTPWDRRLALWLESAVVAPFREFATRPNWIAVLGFVTVYKLGDAYAGHMAITFYLHLGFTKSEVGEISKLMGLIATLAGGLAGGAVVGRLGVLRALLVCGLLQMASTLLYLAVGAAGHDTGVLAVAIVVENIAQGMGTAALVAFLSDLCAVSFTATQYALLSALAGFGRTLFAGSSGMAVAALGWSGFFLLSAALALPGLGLALLLRVGRRSGEAA